jgi:SOS response regulatory protein OraA/RecX
MDVITGVLRLKGKVRITVDGKPDILIPASIFRNQPLSQGDILDLDEYNQSIAPVLYRHALDHAVKYLTGRARSRKEVETKLRLYGYPDETVKMALYKLEKTGVLNDSEFARHWTQARCEKGLGKKNIARDLRQKGITLETAEAALKDVDEAQQLYKARQLVEKWRPRYLKEESRDAARKLMQALIRRGYDWEISKTAVDFVNEENN